MRMSKIYLFLLLLSSSSWAQNSLPDLILTNLEGKSRALKTDFVQTDKLYVFSFWATWCGPCIEELEAINEVEADWKKTINFEILAVSTDDSRTQKRVKPLANGKDWTFEVLLDTNQDFKRALSIVNIPYLIVVKNNAIVHVQSGYAAGGENELFEKLKQL